MITVQIVYPIVTAGLNYHLNLQNDCTHPLRPFAMTAERRQRMSQLLINGIA